MKIFATLDIDNDGDVTEEEFVQGCLKDEELVIINIILAINIITNINSVTNITIAPTNYTIEGGGSQRRQDKATTCSTQQRDHAQKEIVRVYVVISIVIIIIITITIIIIIIIIIVIVITIDNIFAPDVVPTLVFPQSAFVCSFIKEEPSCFSNTSETPSLTHKLPNP